MKSPDLIVLSHFPSVADAQIAKGVLDQAGIHAIIRTDNAGGMFPPLGSVELIVRAEDLERANQFLQDIFPA